MKTKSLLFFVEDYPHMRPFLDHLHVLYIFSINQVQENASFTLIINLFKQNKIVFQIDKKIIFTHAWVSFYVGAKLQKENLSGISRINFRGYCTSNHNPWRSNRSALNMQLCASSCMTICCVVLLDNWLIILSQYLG